MENTPPTKQWIDKAIWHWDEQKTGDYTVRLLGEEPLSIRIEGKPYSVIMRTPGDEIAHVAGFCLAEGVIDTPDQVGAIAFCDEDTNVVAVTLSAERRAEASHIVQRRGFISQTSCGICGKEVIEDLYQQITPLEDDVKIDLAQALAHLEKLSDYQPLRNETRAAHCAMVVTSDFEILASAEDIGRHNAVDKAIGHVFLERALNRAAVMLMSSRTSYELVQKAARARIPVIVAMSRPTSLAVALAEKLNITLICRAIGSGLYIYSGKQRIKAS
jgi:FdhD protein